MLWGSELSIMTIGMGNLSLMSTLIFQSHIKHAAEDYIPLLHAILPQKSIQTYTQTVYQFRASVLPHTSIQIYIQNRDIYKIHIRLVNKQKHKIMYQVYRKYMK